MNDRKMIYLDDAIDAVSKACHEFRGIFGECKDSLLALPSAQPDVIRCKDCKYYRWEIDMCDEPYSTAHNVVHEYDYCSRAERETDEQND